MKKITIAIFVCMLMIFSTSIVIADWIPGDGHKMHFPQMPDPNGFDVDFGYWEMGDDWQCSETGYVFDIHFWISWFYDDPMDIPWIKCSIWSNEPNGPHGFSIPKEILWEQTFQTGQFIIAGPWDGQQRWFMPWGEVIPEYHYLYWQVNIPEIDEPFLQQKGEIYWLIVDMPFDVEFLVGWKNTKDYFMDHACWRPPGGDWMMIDGIDFAFVITGGSIPIPDLVCEGQLVWSNINPGDTVTGTFVVKNDGDLGSSLNWHIASSPGFGTWSYSPSSGTGLPAGGSTTVTATCVAPAISNTFTGNVKVENSEDPADFCLIDVELTTPRGKLLPLPIIIKILERFPNAFPILRQILLEM